MLKHILSVLAFMAVTFGVQGLSHFVVNKPHFDSIGFTRPEPIMPLGFLVMIIQGLIMTFALSAWRDNAVSIRDGLVVSFAFGLFLVSYVAITEPAKYMVPSIPAWLMIEGSAGFFQYAIYGVLLGFIHKKFG